MDDQEANDASIKKYNEEEVKVQAERDEIISEMQNLENDPNVKRYLELKERLNNLRKTFEWITLNPPGNPDDIFGY